MSSHMLAPFRRAWQDEVERDNEPDDADAALCQVCGTEPAEYVTRDGRVVCPEHWFSTFVLPPLEVEA